MKNYYIEDFCEDLNYRPVILYIDPKISLSDLLKRLKKDLVNHLYKFYDCVGDNRLFYIENCDLQCVTVNKNWNELYELFEDGFSVLQLKKDDNGYFIEVPDVIEWRK